MADQKFKSKVRAQGGINLPAETASRAPIIDGSGNLVSSSVTSTELGHLSGVTGPVQTQITDAQDDATQALSDAADAQTDINDHIVDTADAHDASAISSIPSGNLAATDLQGAVNELQSDIDTRALDSAVIKKDGSVAFTAAQSMGGFKLTSLAVPTAASDAATKGYVDSALEGLKAKEAVRAATTVAGTLATSFEDADVIDGVTLATGDRILIKNQVAAEDNGIYIVQASGAPVRSADFDSISPIDEVNKAFVAVQEGTSNAGKLFVQYGLVTTIGTDAINFVFFNSVSGLTGGDGITVSGSNIEVDHDGEGLTFVAGQLALELDGSTLSKSASGLKLGNVAVTPGTVGSAVDSAQIVVDQQGRVTSILNVAIAIPSTQVTDFDEAAQDAVGTILTDSSSIDFTYSDGTPSITAVVLPAGVDHDALANFVANEHINHSSVSIATTSSTSGLSGGGDITATRTLVVDITGTTALAATPDVADEVMIWDASASARKKVTIAELLSGVAVGSPGDISETSFSASNNQAAAANVTGLAFASGVTRGFKALVSIEIDATLDSYETFELVGINKNGSFDMAVSSVGDESGVVFSITSGGQVQYTSANSSGFVTNLIKFRAETTTV
jgi:hypothetical protein